MSSIINKEDLVKVTSDNMVKSGLQSQEVADRFAELCNQQSGWDLILRWATEEDHQEAAERFNQL